jgi:putative ABC transport system permease protein
MVLTVRQLVRLILFRYLRAARGRVMLTVIGIVLGVAVVFAVDLVNASVLGAFRRSIADVTGKAKLSVGAGVGVDESALEKVRAIPGVDGAIPIIETTLRDVRAHSQLAVLAVDTLSDPGARGYDVVSQDAHIDDVVAFLNDPHGVLVTPSYAKRAGLKVGDELLLDTPQGRKDFRIHGTLEPRGLATVYGGDLLLMDVYAAQVAFDRGHRFDRIDVIPAPGVDVTSLASEVERALDHKVPLSRPERRAAEAERLIAGYRLALSLASLVALFVGAFIIFNSLAIAVAQRRREIGILRALGTTRAQILFLFVGEGVVIGLAGAGLGLGFGYLMAHAALGAVAATISALYMPIKVVSIVVTAKAFWSAVGLGISSATVAAFVPARRAATIDPVSAMSGTIQSADVAMPSTRVAVLACCGVLLLTAATAYAAHAYINLTLAIIVAALLLSAGTFLAPLLASVVGRLAQRYAKYVGPATLLGAVAFSRNRGRNVVSIAALGLALANVVNTDTLVGSMTGTTDAWLARSFRADVFVFAGTEVHAKFEHPLPPTLRDELKALPDVDFVQAFRMVQQSYRGEPYYLMSEDFEGYRHYNELAIVAGNLSEALPQLDAGTGIAASETFARAFEIKLGDTVTLDTANGPQAFKIALVYTDYRADIGILFTTRSAYQRIFRDDLVDLYSVYLKKGASADQARALIAQRFGAQYGLLALGSEDYKHDLVDLIHRAMSLARATELVAVVVAGLGIINVLLVGVLDRRREIGVLKALGTDRKQLSRVVLTEAILIACTAALLGVVLGTVLSVYMVLEALRIEVGWHLSLHVSGWIFVETFAIAIPIAALAAWWPIRWVSRLEVVDALQYE